MGVRDLDIEWARQRMFIPYQAFNGYVEATDTFQSNDNGNPVPADFGNGLAGLAINATNDAVSHTMCFPSQWDISQDIGVRVIYGHNANPALATDSATWAIAYKQTDQNGALGNPTTALDTAIAAQLCPGVAQYSTFKSPRGIITSGTFDEDALDGFLAFTVAVGISGYGADEVHLFGVEWDYIPMMTVGGWNADINDRAGI